MNNEPIGSEIRPTVEQFQNFQPQSHDPQDQFQVPPVLEEIRNKTDGTPESIKKYFETLSFGDFSQFLNRLNGYFRNITGQHNMDGDGVMANGYVPPDPKDRIPLMLEAFEKAIKEDSIEKCAVVLGVSILTIHPYLDGNGRVSRIIFALLTTGYSGNKESKALFAEIGQKDDDKAEEPQYFGHSRGDININLDPENVKVGDVPLSNLIEGEMKWSALKKRFGDNLTDYPVRVGSLRGLNFKYNPSSKLSEEEQRELNNIFGSDAIAFLACVNSFSDELYNKSLKDVEFDGNRYKIISCRNIIEDITKDDLLRLRMAFRQATIDYVREVMNVTERDDFQDIFDQYSVGLEKWKEENQN